MTSGTFGQVMKRNLAVSDSLVRLSEKSSTDVSGQEPVTARRDISQPPIASCPIRHDNHRRREAQVPNRRWQNFMGDSRVSDTPRGATAYSQVGAFGRD